MIIQRLCISILLVAMCAVCDVLPGELAYPTDHPYQGMIQKPDGTWVLRNTRIKNWTIKDSRADSTLFESDTFDNVTFQNVAFIHTTLRKNVFLNCHFENVIFAGGEWLGNRHIGGVMQQIEMRNVENPYVWDNDSAGPKGPRNTRIDSNLIENVEVRNWSFAAGFPNAYKIQTLTFRNCRLQHNNMGNAVKVTGQILMDSCDIGERAWSMREGLRQRKCRQSQYVDWIVGQRIDSMTVLNVDGDSVIDVISDAKGGPRKERYAMARHYARNVQFRNLYQSEVGGGEDILIENIKGSHVNLQPAWNPSDTVYIRRATLRNLDVDVFRLGLSHMVYEDCLFENIKSDELELHYTTFRRCTFRNVRIRKKITRWTKMPIFLDCVFENVHRDPGVKIHQILDPYDPEWTPYANIRLPWEDDKEWQRIQKPWWKLW